LPPGAGRTEPAPTQCPVRATPCGPPAPAPEGPRAAEGPAGAAAFGAESRLSPAGRQGAPVLYAQSRTVIAIVRPVGSNRDANSQLRVAFGSASGSFGASHLIVKRPGIARPVLAGNAKGDLALAWFEDRGTSNDRVYVSLRPAGGSFGAPILLAQERVRNVSAAVGPQGRVLVAWDAVGAVRTRLKAGAGRSPFAKTDTIRSEPAFFADLRTAVAPNGRAYVAWGAQFRSEGGTTGPVFFEAAVRPARAARFRLAQLLDRLPEERSANPLEIALVGNGATVGWTGFDGTANRVRVAETDAHAVFGAPHDVSPTDSTLTDIASGPGGQRLVVWTTGTGSPRSVQAAFAVPGAGFGTPELISGGLEAESAVAAFDPLTSVPTVMWTNRPDGSAHPLAEIRTYAQASTRSG
jgi:hypothetical protein